MLAVLRKKAVAAGAANLEIVRAGFLSYDHAGPLAGGVFTRNALHQIPDFWKGIALTRIAGILRPGGVLRLRPSPRLPAGRGRRGLRCLVRGRRQGPG